MPQLGASLTHDSKGIIYDHNMFIIQATGYLYNGINTMDMVAINCQWQFVKDRKTPAKIAFLCDLMLECKLVLGPNVTKLFYGRY